MYDLYITFSSFQSEGCREDLVSRLKLWHVQKYTSQGLHGGNFHLLPVKENTVPQPYLSPFKRIEVVDHRSILRKRSRFSNGSTTSGMNALPMRVSRKSLGRRKSQADDDMRSPEKSRSKKTVQFSPYNKVQLMSPRRQTSFFEETLDAEDLEDLMDDSEEISSYDEFQSPNN